MIQGLDWLDTSRCNSDFLDIFLIFCAIICFFCGIPLTGCSKGIRTGRSTPLTTRKACVSCCLREDSSPNSLAVPSRPPKIASSTTPFELQRLDCQIFWREWINRPGWYIFSQLRQKEHRCRWSKQCAQT